MKIKSIELKVAAYNKNKYPDDGLTQIAVIGRSNVGKSSFINTIVNRKNFARVSQKPGKTQGINFYLVNNSFYLVDLPGYGYAEVSKEMKKQWSINIETYLNVSEYLKGAIMLVDIRHKPTDDDVLMMNYLKHRNLNYVVVATKSDKLNRQEIQRSLNVISETLEVDKGKIVPFSSLKKTGVDNIYTYLDSILEDNKRIED
ncbi:YihA family ribosome biogenesis GTP-binding protein [Thermoanaerobacterium thermosaccharolyticum]|uniref:Probable GTP-binding protein EngB n=1 Tax=Thermoanaerobacterium thermosaccharolyticum TaxID=1517 RepID=A0A231VMP2_THETR|nr:ribosome biogenesis GTP-binding protein YihA/YsxC [Thermoanaerobacterium thermosaccharolyticum]KAA5808250.1 YihA family ribosome biogenesis GTP-binding protein [Thermoanaerobacterium thermosaccharolyticum]OXT09480.1 YihA family ribosome biogenesis GTP-binding protein [Thermoanaerobacterium thermosaccharolyticum]PHO08135.1 YihA family ribosome biogenesis GTP-binding protein [Thermoanaerobacterium thermosaccharolyticum]